MVSEIFDNLSTQKYAITIFSYDFSTEFERERNSYGNRELEVTDFISSVYEENYLYGGNFLLINTNKISVINTQAPTSREHKALVKMYQTMSRPEMQATNIAAQTITKPNTRMVEMRKKKRE